MRTRFAIAIFATAILMSPLAGQIRPAAPGVGVAGRGASVGRGAAGGPGHLHHGRSAGRGSIVFPYPYYYSDYGYDYDYQEPAPPPVIVMPAAAPAQAPPAAPLEPLLIEWHGDHFERMTMSQKASSNGQNGPDYSEKSNLRSSTSGLSAAGSSARSSNAPARKVAVEPPPRELPPAVLVFRDGRKEELSSYTIMSGTIYSKADYWTNGSWTKKIQIADLDVPATLKLNQEHGLNFVLPAGPNEVVLRP